MQEGKRQKQIGGLLQEELSDVLQRLNLNMMDGGLISISSVKLTPDLLEARIYLSFFQVANAEQTMQKIKDRAWEVKRELSGRVKQQLRRIPELKFFQDDTLDQVFKMEEIFKQIKQQDDGTEEQGMLSE